MMIVMTVTTAFRLILPHGVFSWHGDDDGDEDNDDNDDNNYSLSTGFNT